MVQWTKSNKWESGWEKEAFEKILDDGKAAPFYFLWTEKEELELVRLKTEPISIHNTALAQLKSRHKLEIMVTFRAMTKDKKASFLKELQEDEVKIKDGAKEKEEAAI